MQEFFPLLPSAFGLDISDLSFKIAYLKGAKQGFELCSFGDFPIAKGIVEQGEVKEKDALVSLVQKAVVELSRKGLATKHVVASLPEEQAFLQVIQLPRMKEAELEYAVRFEAENYIPHPLEKVYLDFQVVEPFHNHLDHTDVLLAALPQSTVHAYVEVLEKAGLSIQALEIESLAVARALVPKETASLPLLLVDFGATRTSFIIFSGYSLRFTASIPISSEQLTKAIAKSLQIKEKEAEDLKIRYGLDRQEESKGKEVFQALIPPLTDFVEQIKRHIGYFESHSQHLHLNGANLAIKRVILSGGGSNLRGFPKFLSQQLEREVFLGNPWVNILATSLQELPPLPFGESIRYATALGLALRGAKEHD